MEVDGGTEAGEFDDAGSDIALLESTGGAEEAQQAQKTDAPPGDDAQCVAGDQESTATGAGAGCKPSVAEVGRTLREQRTRSSIDERAAGSAGSASGGSGVRADMLASLQGQMAACSGTFQTQTATVIREEVAEVKQALGTVQGDIGAVQEVVANTSARGAGMERDVDKLKQAQDEMMKMAQDFHVEAVRAKRAPRTNRGSGGDAQALRNLAARSSARDRACATGVAECGGRGLASRAWQRFVCALPLA